MLENSLKIRGKFINKLVDKLEDLNNDLILLGKLDKKIYKKNNSQKGGNTANPVQLQLTTYAKEQELKEEQKKLNTAIESTNNIGQQIETMNKALGLIIKQIDEFQIKIPALTNMNVGVSLLEPFEMTNLKKKIEERVSWDTFSNSTKPGDPELRKKVNEEMYNKLINGSNPAPAAASATATPAATPARPAATPARPTPARSQ